MSGVHNFLDNSYSLLERRDKEKDGYGKFGYLGGIFGRFGALRGDPGVRDGRCAPPGGWGGTTIQKDLTFDGFKMAVPLFTYKKKHS